MKTKMKTRTIQSPYSPHSASALFAHDKHKIACLSIWGTVTIQDVVKDIQSMPVPFPQQQVDNEEDQDHSNSTSHSLDYDERNNEEC